MFEENNTKPVAVVKDSITPSVSCSIWERQGEHGKWYTVGAPQIAKNVGKKTGTDEWKYFGSFSASEVPAAVRVLNQALEKVGELLSKERVLKRENGNSIQAGKAYGNTNHSGNATGTYDDESYGEDDIV